MAKPAASVSGNAKRQPTAPWCSRCSVQQRTEGGVDRAKIVTTFGHGAQLGVVVRANDDSRACRQQKMRRSLVTFSSCDSMHLRHTNGHVITNQAGRWTALRARDQIALDECSSSTGTRRPRSSSQQQPWAGHRDACDHWVSTRETLFVGLERRFLMLCGVMLAD